MMSLSQRAVEMVLSGRYSQIEAARELGIWHSTVSYGLRRRGIRTGMTERGRQAIREYCKSDEARRIRKRAAELRAFKHRKEAGIPEPERILAYVASGHTYAEAALKWGLTRGQVAGYVHRHKKAAQA